MAVKLGVFTYRSLMRIKLPMKRSKVSNDLCASKDTNEDDNPIVSNDDPYFGAQLLSESTIIEEFGYVPSRSKKSLSPYKDGLEPDGCLIFHDNAYDEIHQLFQEIIAPVDTTAKSDRKCERVPLKDKSNIRTVAIEFNKMKTVDEEFDEEIYDMCNDPKILDMKNDEHWEELFSLNPSDRYVPIEVRKKRSCTDLYTPKWVRGKGPNREGYCELCRPGVWLKIKQSAYWYHMNFIHGISATTGRPHPPPVEIREEICERSNGERLNQIEGRCGNCDQWVVIAHQLPSNANVTPKDALNNVWWRHVQKCGVNRKEYESEEGKQVRKRPNRSV